MREHERIKRRLAAIDTERERLFRFNAGMGWTGLQIKKIYDLDKIVQMFRHQKEIPDFLLLTEPRPFHGAPTGFSDLAGWQTIEITPDMIGQKIAVWKSVEVKTKKYHKLSPAQEKFRDLVRRMGGIYEVDHE
jgi:hypothetical protein